MTSLFMKSSSARAFTLAEIIVAITILSLVMLSVFEIYSNILSLNQRLELSRILQKNARDVTELIAKDVRDTGIDIGYYTPATGLQNYSGSGASVLAIRSSTGTPTLYYLMQDDSIVGHPVDCQHKPGISCYFGKAEFGGGQDQYTRLTDANVNITSLAFFVSGQSANSYRQGATSSAERANEAKVTIAFGLEIAQNKGISKSLLDASKLQIETTISEKLYKSY